MSGLDLSPAVLAAIDGLASACDRNGYHRGEVPEYRTETEDARSALETAIRSEVKAARAAVIDEWVASDLRSDLAAARAEADALRGLVGEACDLYGVLFARYNTLRASAGLALDGGDGKIVAIRARAGKTGGR